VHGLHANAPFGNERGVVLPAGRPGGRRACDHADLERRGGQRRPNVPFDDRSPPIPSAAIGRTKGER
jgi:hypothetical protein